MSESSGTSPRLAVAATWAFGELPMGHETCEGCAEMGGAAYGSNHSGAYCYIRTAAYILLHAY